jgi:PilZ domain-containing protein
MKEHVEARIEKRVAVEGGSVKYRKLNGNAFSGKFTEQLQLKNLSHTGACFEIHHYLRNGDTLLIDIITPENDNIQARGIVKWTQINSWKGLTEAGVEFSQFGWGDPWNFTHYKKKLGNILKSQLN